MFAGLDPIAGEQREWRLKLLRAWNAAVQRLAGVSAGHAKNRYDLPQEIEDAMDLFERAPVGRQLADPNETAGRCGRASGRFISALRESGADGSIIEWSELENAWHHAVLLPDGETVVDWTASQFETDDLAAQNCPYPRVEPLATAIKRWGDPATIDPDDKLARWVHDVPDLMPWTEAQERIPEEGSAQEKEIRG